MSIPLEGRPKELANSNLIRACKLYIIEKTDSSKLYFTDNDYTIEWPATAEFPTGLTFTPIGGHDVSTLRNEIGLKASGGDFIGVIHSDYITTDDLRQRKYHGAKITMYTVDRKFPYMGYFKKSVLYVADVQYDEWAWSASVAGVAEFLRPKVGGIYTAECQHRFGDTGCTINIELYKIGTFPVTTSIDPKPYIVTASSLPLQVDNFYKRGLVWWATGNNAGVNYPIVKSVGVQRELYLGLTPKYPVQNGDTFYINYSCDATLADCIATFSNGINFKGHPFMPGMDKVMETPDSLT